MSLVLEALKKLEREKGREERGFVVMAATPWPTRAAHRWPLWIAIAVLAAAAGWALAGRRTPRPATAIVSAAPAASAATSTPASLAPDPALSVPARTPGPAVRRAVAAPPATAAAGSAPEPARAADDASVPGRPPTPAASAPGAVAGATPAPPALVLQAISERDGKPIAIVNDRLVREGDEVNGIRVLAIRADEVVVEFQGRRTTLRF